ncbi:hypothetical protein FMN63_15725 [Stappia sp. BW2]|jgi:hypothetical protein|uniref:hypothetical protein n=1 Tax=Stappia sp. BW2 TaxID=2592622 RepID=UPI0011DE6B27|nr:hypothetical protein [Stappia sp. BW2]TYC67515.1 hypothetical protein FMN63_15725 [Stappia sp. BW2]
MIFNIRCGYRLKGVFYAFRLPQLDNKRTPPASQVNFNPESGHWKRQRTRQMSEQSASRPAPKQNADAKLVNLYKPVGIAALNAAALCKNSGTAAKKKN